MKPAGSSFPGVHTVENYTPGKTINQLTPGEVIYITKKKNGYIYTYQCEFLYRKGTILYGKPLLYSPDWINHPTDNLPKISCRYTACYLWGLNKSDNYSVCHWFNKKTKAVK